MAAPAIGQVTFLYDATVAPAIGHVTLYDAVFGGAVGHVMQRLAWQSVR